MGIYYSFSIFLLKAYEYAQQRHVFLVLPVFLGSHN